MDYYLSRIDLKIWEEAKWALHYKLHVERLSSRDALQAQTEIDQEEGGYLYKRGSISELL